MSEFDIDQAIRGTNVGPHRWEIDVTTDWNTPNKTPNGGYILGLVLAAAKADSPLPDALSASVTYLKPTAPGRARIETAVIRAGNKVTTMQATLYMNEEPTTHLVASFIDRTATTGSSHPSPDPIAIPPVDDCIDLFEVIPPDVVPFAHHFKYRHPQTPGWIQGEPSGDMRADFWMTTIDDRPIDDLALAIMVDAYPPVTAEIGELASATVQLTVHFRANPTPGWLQMAVCTHHVINGFHEEDVDVRDEAGNLVAQSRQIAILS